ncbi:DNA-3-methyladenine glycosylase I [Aeromonas aquatica]|uniref:DNA-3-methyladenine glycosylase I n=1 Tax=Aeromonas aquatica TaxID=558964 RepID=UPI00237834C4|nr:DNA-3-methyladenine glycosylase I [Aeromonas aquatica]
MEEEGRPAASLLPFWPAISPGSDAMVKALKRLCLTLVGSPGCCASMRALGLVNDHLVAGPCQAPCQQDQGSVFRRSVQPAYSNCCSKLGHSSRGFTYVTELISSPYPRHPDPGGLFPAGDLACPGGRSPGFPRRASGGASRSP